MYKCIQPGTHRLFQYLTPGQFVKLLKTDRGSIKKTKFIAPRIGAFNLGKVYVEYYYVPKTRTPEKRQKSKDRIRS